MIAMDDREMPVQDRKRIAGDNEVVTVFQSHLFGREILRTQKAFARLDRRLVYVGGGAPNPGRVVLNYQVRPFCLWVFQSPGSRVLQAKVTGLHHGPIRDLVTDQRVDSIGK